MWDIPIIGQTEPKNVIEIALEDLAREFEFQRKLLPALQAYLQALKQEDE